MDFELDADQRDLQDTARAIVAKECSAAFVRSVVDDGIDPSAWWQTLVSLDWPALAIEEDAGGLGMTLGRAGDRARGARPGDRPVAVPRHDDTVRAGRAPVRGRRADRSLAGRRRRRARQRARSQWKGCTTARAATSHRPTRAAPTDGGWQLDGRIADVIDGDRADEIAVAAATDEGIAVFVVPRALERGVLSFTRTPALDPTMHVADLELDGVVVADDRRLRGVDPRPRPRPGDRGGDARRGRHDGRRVSADPRSHARPREGTPPVRQADRVVPGRQAQGRRHVRRHRAGPGARLVRRPDDRRGRRLVDRSPCRWPRPPPASASDSSSSTGSSCSARWASRGRTTSSSPCGGPSSARWSSDRASDHRRRIAREVLAG